MSCAGLSNSIISNTKKEQYEETHANHGWGSGLALRLLEERR